MKPPIKNFSGSSILMITVEAIEKFQAAHLSFLKKETEESTELMAQSLQTVKMLQAQLSSPDETADQIRIGFLQQATVLEKNIQNLHAVDLYPDLYRDSESQFMLMNDIINCFKTALISKGEAVPLVELSTTVNPWKDYGIVAFCRDVTNNLKNTKFKSYWDALQWYEKNKSTLTYTFEILSMTGNLGKQ